MLTHQNATVVLLHGLGRSRLSMAPMAWHLQAAGFTVRNLGYPSRRKSWQALAQHLAQSLRLLTPNQDVHFVTHSMGAIVLRHFFADARFDDLRARLRFQRAVLLGPPNQGSEIVDAWGKRWWFRAVLGASGSSLSTDPSDPPKSLPTLPLHFGVIAGGNAPRNWLLPGVPAPHDGKVSVASTHLDGMADFTCVPVGHTWLPNHPQCRALTLQFLQTGQFPKAEHRP